MTVEDYLKLPYTRILRQDDEGDWIVKIQELDGCMTSGSTLTEALEHLDEVMRMWIEGMIERHTIPLPEKAWWE